MITSPFKLSVILGLLLMVFAFTQLLLDCTKEMVEVFCKSQLICYQRSFVMWSYFSLFVLSSQEKISHIGWSGAEPKPCEGRALSTGSHPPLFYIHDKANMYKSWHIHTIHWRDFIYHSSYVTPGENNITLPADETNETTKYAHSS